MNGSVGSAAGQHSTSPSDYCNLVAYDSGCLMTLLISYVYLFLHHNRLEIYIVSVPDILPIGWRA